MKGKLVVQAVVIPCMDHPFFGDAYCKDIEVKSQGEVDGKYGYHPEKYEDVVTLLKELGLDMSGRCVLVGKGSEKGCRATTITTHGRMFADKDEHFPPAIRVELQIMRLKEEL